MTIDVTVGMTDSKLKWDVRKAIDMQMSFLPLPLHLRLKYLHISQTYLR